MSEQSELPIPKITNPNDISPSLRGEIQALIREELASSMEAIKKEAIEQAVSMIGSVHDKDMGKLWSAINDNASQIEINIQTNARTRSMTKFHDHGPSPRSTPEN